MHPILLRLGSLPIRSYGFMILIGFLTAVWMATRRGKREDIDPNFLFDLCFYLLLVGIVASKLFYILQDPIAFGQDIKATYRDPIQLIQVIGGGFVFYGGFIPAMLFAVYYIRRSGHSVWQIGDILAPSLALGHGFGRIGCFLAGCCYGRSCHAPWAVTFMHPESLAPHGIPLHPTQLYAAFSLFLIAGLLSLFWQYRRFHGQIFWSYVILYASARLVIEFYRDDFRPYVPGTPFSISQFLALILIAVAVGMIAVLRKRSRT